MKYKDYPIDKLIPLLLAQHRESEIWDAKEEWHDNTPDLIKDIICFANTTHDEDCYLIFGITDNLKVKGLSGKRYKQSDILDTLSNLQFAGDNIPDIKLYTINYQSDFVPDKLVEIDVLVIKNTYLTPIFLKRTYGNMTQGCIYSRTGDKNTPNKGNADIKQIEMLWRKRFGLTKPPLEYIIDRLHNKSEWKQYNEAWYNIYKPEYCLRIISEEEEHDSDEFYSYSQTNENSTFQTLEIVANNTVLFQYQTVCLDGGRLLIPVPEHGFLNIIYKDCANLSYRYYIKNSERFAVLCFLYNSSLSDEKYAFDNLMEVVLVFQNISEKEKFEEHIILNEYDFMNRIKTCNRYNYIKTGDARKTEVYKNRLRTGIVLNEMLLEYRNFKS